MDLNEREKYKGAKKVEVDKKKPVFEDTRQVYNCLGQLIDEPFRIEKERQNKEMKNAEFIENLLKASIEQNRLLDEVFYFFSASYYAKRKPDIYPAEISLAKFSLGEGVTDVFQMFINPGEVINSKTCICANLSIFLLQLPLGFAYMALEHSKKTHRLPVPPKTIGETNYHKVLDEMLNFLEVKEFCSTYVPPFYVYSDFQGDDYEAAAMILEKIADENKCNNGFRVLRAEQLLFSLNRQILCHFEREDSHPFSSFIQAKDAMRHDNYRYSEIGCEVHNQEDNSQMCTLSKVKRWAFSIVEHCGLDLEKIPGQHMPVPKTTDLYEDFEEEDLGSCLTESLHQMKLDSTISTQSLLSDQAKMSSIPSEMSIKPTFSFLNRLKYKTNYQSSLKSSDSTITANDSDFSQIATAQFSMRSATNIDDTVKNFGESWTKKIVKNYLPED